MKPLQPGDEVTIRGRVVVTHQTASGKRLVIVHVDGPNGSVTRLTLWESQLEPVLTESNLEGGGS